MQSLTNNWLVASNITWGIWWIFTKPLKILTISFQWVLFDKVYKVLATKMQRSYFSWHQTVMQHVKKPWPCGLKNDIRNWMSTQNSETLYLHLDGFFFFLRHIMLQWENFITIMCADTEGWCNLKKQKQKACGWKNSLTNLVNVYGNSRKSESLLFDGLFYPKYIMSELKATSWFNLWRKYFWRLMQSLTGGLKNDIRNLVSFHDRSRKSENLHFDGLVFVLSWSTRQTFPSPKWVIFPLPGRTASITSLHFSVNLYFLTIP